MKKKILAVALGLTLCFGMIGCTSSDDLAASNITNEQQSKCEHEYKEIDWHVQSYSDGSNIGYDIYCHKCEYETNVSYKEWNKIQADIEYKKENKAQ